MYIFRQLALEASAVLLLLPVYCILNKYWLHNGKKAALYWLLSCYFACVYALVGLPNVTYIRFDPNVNLIPFLGLVDDLKNCILNVVLFLPLGFLLPLMCDRFRAIKTAAWTGFGASLTIELLQIFAGRATDVNDLIANTLGAVLGYLMAHICVKKRPMVNGTGRELLLVSGLCIGTMFFLQPFLTRWLWGMIFLGT